MLSQGLRASRQSLARATLRSTPLALRRTFITPTANRQADLVQDLYLRELKSYKAAPVKPSDATGHVQHFTMPKPPASPEEADISNDLKAYKDQAVEVEGQETSSGAGPAEQDWFEEEEEEEEEQAHH